MSHFKLEVDPCLLALTDPPGEHVPVMGLGASIEFRVYGRPAPKGSRKGTGRMAKSKTGRVFEITRDDSNYQKPWAKAVKAAAEEAAQDLGWIPLMGPAMLELWFFREPPKSPLWKAQGVPDVIPDADKLARSVGDSLSGILYDDDKRVTDLLARKRYGRPGVYVRLTGLVELARPTKRS